jgi:hypothetical protein
MKNKEIIFNEESKLFDVYFKGKKVSSKESREEAEKTLRQIILKYNIELIYGR